MTKAQARYADFKGRGLCVRCGRRTPVEGQRRCRWCKAKVNKVRRLGRARKAQEAIQ